MLFLQVLLPVFLIILSGFTLEKTLRPDFKTLTDCSLYLFTPALVFSSLMRQELRPDLAGKLFLFMLLYTAVMLALSRTVSRLLRFDTDTRSALDLTTVVMNSGNYGLPLAYFAFGQAGLQASILTFVMFSIPLGTLAIVLAQGSKAPLGQALANTLRIPIFHGVLLAVLFKALGVQVSGTLLRPFELLGQAAIPLMLVLLGMQLARTRRLVRPGFLGLSGSAAAGRRPAFGVAFDGPARDSGRGPGGGHPPDQHPLGGAAPALRGPFRHPARPGGQRHLRLHPLQRCHPHRPALSSPIKKGRALRPRPISGKLQAAAPLPQQSRDHFTTRVARLNAWKGTVRLSSLATFMLITRATFLGVRTGSSRAR